MRYFDSKSTLFLIIFCLPLLFLPKINLLSFGGRETAGIRIDDLVLLGTAVLILWAHFALDKKMLDIEKWMFALVGFSFLSFLSNRMMVAVGILHVKAIVFYVFRIFEYFIFFYIGLFCTRFMNPSKVIKVFFAWNLLLMLLQKAGLIGQFGSWGYLSTATDRVSGIASFPSEAGLFLNLSFCYLIYDDKINWKKVSEFSPILGLLIKRTYVYLVFLICALLIIWTGSRIAILALAFTFLFKVKDDINWRSPLSLLMVAVFFVIACVVMTTVMMNTNSIYSRSAGLLSFKNIELFSLVWDQISLDYDPIGNEAVKFDAYDMSWWMRIHKWIYALKIYLTHPECYLQGVGPGFAMAALDGGFIRILTEYGIVGSYFFYKFFSCIYQKSTQLKWMVIAFMINMIFFDAYLAYKPMSLLFLVTGFTYARSIKPIGSSLKVQTT